MQHQAEEKLLENERRLHLALDAGGLAPWEIKLDTGEVIGSPQLRRLFGLTDEMEASLREHWRRMIVEEDRPLIQPAMDAAVQGRAKYHVQFRIHRTDGELRWLDCVGNVVEDDSGKPTRLIGVCADITERKQAQEALRESEERLRQAIRVAGLGLFEHDHATNEVYVSSLLREIWGWRAGEAITLARFVETVAPEDRASFLAEVERAHDPAGDGAFSSEHRIVWPDGSFRWVNARSQTTFAGEGANRRAVRTIGALMDITERKQAEDRLRSSERWFRALTEKAAEDIILLDAEGRVIYESPHEYPLLGYAPGEMKGRNGLELVHPDDLALARQNLRDVTATPGNSVQSELRMRRRDGAWSWIHFFATNLLHEPAVGAVVLNLHDITARKQAEEELRLLNTTLEQQVADRTRELRESEQRLRSALRGASGGAWDWNLQRDEAWWSREMCELWGIPPGHPMRLEDALSLVHAQDREGLSDDIAQCLDGRADFFSEFRILHQELGERWMCAHGVLIRDEADRPLRLIGITLDVTERKHAENALRESEQRLAGIVGSAMDAIVSIDEQQCIRLFNPAAEQMFGIRAADILGQPLARLLPERFRRKHEEHIHEFATTGVTSREMGALGELSGLRANGEEFPVEASISQVTLASGKLFTVILRDITARKQAEAELKQRARELRESNEELSRFNRAAVGRELRMIELKREVNELLAEAGKAPRYALEFDREPA